MAFKVDPDYVDVAERIREFKTAYPDGTLQPVDHDNPYIVQEVAGETVIVLSLIHIRRCRRSTLCRSRWSPYH